MLGYSRSSRTGLNDKKSGRNRVSMPSGARLLCAAWRGIWQQCDASMLRNCKGLGSCGNPEDPSHWIACMKVGESLVLDDWGTAVLRPYGLPDAKKRRGKPGPYNGDAQLGCSTTPMVRSWRARMEKIMATT